MQSYKNQLIPIFKQVQESKKEMDISKIPKILVGKNIYWYIFSKCVPFELIQ